MKMMCVYGWDCTHPELIEKVEKFISTWQNTEDNASYSHATFYGIMDKESSEFREIEEDEKVNFRNVQYHIECQWLRGGAEVRATLLLY
ncbi:hypothetical protein [Flavihumibacter sp. CACIAM 22H1]|uniref:hypothetical protein n=1 Tax=Flavihumibacter sp. CACIAM 22H1 TaxID=1812911 RepID=UPI0007A7EA7A|nr:hypothetical protein [Flavihumibacter sp. CACIAM 22H1]KYP12910.1 MAG: hypothetical protein A1D16_04045 [Flavihumibacter sp. CACIAM 22H1]